MVGGFESFAALDPETLHRCLSGVLKRAATMLVITQPLSPGPRASWASISSGPEEGRPVRLTIEGPMLSQGIHTVLGKVRPSQAASWAVFAKTIQVARAIQAQALGTFGRELEHFDRLCLR
jgi:hypothetical protein